MPVRSVRSNLALEVGQRLRSLREARGLTLAATAQRSGLGKGTLSELETGRRNPTLDTLFAVTTALGVPLSAVLPPLDAHGRSVTAPIAGDAIEATLVRRFDDAAAATEVYRVRIPAGGAQRSAAHAPGVTEHWLLFAGALAAGPDGAQAHATAGEDIAFAADTAHSYRAGPDGDVSATLIVRYPT
jgi:transcriptional regulator with XRE-family HTH domain